VDLLQRVRPGQGEDVVVALQVPGMIPKAVPPIVPLLEGKSLEHGSHGSVQDQDPVADRRLEGFAAIPLVVVDWHSVAASFGGQARRSRLPGRSVPGPGTPRELVPPGTRVCGGRGGNKKPPPQRARRGSWLFSGSVDFPGRNTPQITLSSFGSVDMYKRPPGKSQEGARWGAPTRTAAARDISSPRTGQFVTSGAGRPSGSRGPRRQAIPARCSPT